MKKGRIKGEKKKKRRVIKYTSKYLYEAYKTAKNSQKQGRIKEGERIFLAGQNIYTCIQKHINTNE